MFSYNRLVVTSYYKLQDGIIYFLKFVSIFWNCQLAFHKNVLNRKDYFSHSCFPHIVYTAYVSYQACVGESLTLAAAVSMYFYRLFIKNI